MMPSVPQVYWRCGLHDAKCSAGLLKLWSAWCLVFRRLLEVVVRMMPSVPQVYCSCYPHDVNCSAGLLQLWSAWCQVFRRCIENVVRIMSSVPQVYWSCGPPDAKCSAGFLKLWSTWCLHQNWSRTFDWCQAVRIKIEVELLIGAKLSA